MGCSSKNVGHIDTLRKNIKNLLYTAACVGVLGLSFGLLSNAPTIAGGETRSISMYQVHTKENLTITYKKDGRFIPSAMKKINYFLRDWRRGSVITIDPKTLDLMWELHADLGSKRPIHIVSGYRSGKTNAFLKRIGRKVAKHSQHTQGKAIDFYFPDVPTVKIRNAALYRKVGGVGYYRSSGGPTGFLHVDSGRIRHWGPPISKTQMASAMSEGRKVAGKRLTRPGAPSEVEPENGKQATGGLVAWLRGKPKPEVQPEIKTAAVPKPEQAAPAYTELNYEGYDENLSDLAEDVVADAERAEQLKKQASTIPASDASSLGNLAGESVKNSETDNADQEPITLAKGYPVPRPRLKPIEIMMLAAANMQIIPASAPPGNNAATKTKIAADQLAKFEPREFVDEYADGNELEELLEETASVDNGAATGQIVNQDGKSDLAAELLAGKSDSVPLIRPAMAMATVEPEFGELWDRLIVNNEAALRRNGTPPSLDKVETSVLPSATILDQPTAVEQQQINRDGKGNLPRRTIKLSKLKQ